MERNNKQVDNVYEITQGVVDQYRKTLVPSKQACITSVYIVDAYITPKQRKIFETFLTFPHETSGLLSFSRDGYLLKFNAFLGGLNNETYVTEGFVNYHTHIYIDMEQKYAPPSYLDIKSVLMEQVTGSDTNYNLVFEKEGCWVYKPLPSIVEAIKKTGINREDWLRSDKLYECVDNANTLYIALSQAKSFFNDPRNNIENFRVLNNVDEYCKLMAELAGIEIKLIKPGETIYLKNTNGCSFSKKDIIGIPPNILKRYRDFRKVNPTIYGNKL